MQPKNIICILFLLVLTISCNSKDLQSIVEKKYKNCNLTSKIYPCKIDFNTDLKDLDLKVWDKIYIIPEGVDIPPEIAALNGWDNVILSESFVQKIIFIKDQNIIYQEGIGPRLSKDDRCLVFEEKKIVCLYPKTSTFIISTDNSLQYYLRRIP